MLNDVAVENNIQQNIIHKIDDKKINRIQSRLTSIGDNIIEKQNIKRGMIQDISYLAYHDNIYNYQPQKEIVVKITLPYDLVEKFNISMDNKYGIELSPYKEIVQMIENFNERFLGKQQHTTSSFLEFNGKEPRKDVLLKLLKIADFIEDECELRIFRIDGLKQLIQNALGNLDPRTSEKYLECLQNFAEKTMGEKLGYYSLYNLSGLKDAVIAKLSEAYNEQK